MSKLDPGSHVLHTKLPELGSGEVIESERGTVRIRFASGDRRFSLEHIGDSFEVLQEAPPPPPVKTRTRRTRASKL